MPKPGTRTPLALKAAKVQLRMRLEQKVVIAQAAQLRRTSLSSFMLEHAYEAAQQVIASHVDIVMPPEAWRAFCKALDAPPRTIPALKALLTRPSVFDQHGQPSPG
ncbi:MAG: DUF1778 domain-containing protein [Gemmataceae bacterium]|nr:DUF1778 domain-containing protein [Gemmataceae bacterium]